MLMAKQTIRSDTVVAWDWLTSLPREWRFVWKTKWTPVKVSYLFCRCVALVPRTSIAVLSTLLPRYWVLAVGWFLLYCFINDHSLEVCERIFKVVPLAFRNATHKCLFIRFR